jgi:iron complex transport system ATP-binding protein
MDPILSVGELSYSYTGSPAQAVFRDVGFSVGSGDVFCLLGPNGTGKSTLLKCISNVFQGWKGRIALEGNDIARLKPADVAKRIGYVPQNQSSPFPFLVQDIVVMGRAPHLDVFSSPGKEDFELALRAMEQVGIRHLASRPCSMLSGGEWQLTLIARALAQEPKLLVLDEPTSHLDLGNQVRILRIVKTLAENGMGIVMASHSPDHAFIAATEVAIMNRGALVCKGVPDEVITDRNMEETYGVQVRVVRVGEGVDRKACFPFPDGTARQQPNLHAREEESA